MSKQYVIGLDFGTDSVRSVLVDAADGNTLGSKVHWYRRWKEGKYCNPEQNQFRQHPLDLIEGMEATIRDVIKETGVKADQVKGICIDTTGSSPIPVDKSGTALSLLPDRTARQCLIEAVERLSVRKGPGDSGEAA